MVRGQDRNRDFILFEQGHLYHVPGLSQQRVLSRSMLQNTKAKSQDWFGADKNVSLFRIYNDASGGCQAE